MPTRILSHVQRVHQALRRSEHLYMVLLAIVIGLLGDGLYDAVEQALGKDKN